MFLELLYRFLVGGVGVSFFAAVGSAFEPKTFAGLFGSAPSIAIVSLAMAFHAHDSEHVRQLATAMLAGSVALFAYGLLCVWVAKSKHIHVLAGSVVAWVGWAIVSICLFFGLLAK
jgi:uncharacterized membrane protein (GlpM family)